MTTHTHSKAGALSALLAGLTLAGQALAADWTGFRGPKGDGIAPGETLPAQLDASMISWTADLPGRGISTPVVVGRQVFVTATTGARHDQLHVLCFDALDGSLRWRRQLWATGRTQTHEKISPATPSPASDGRRLFVIYSSNDCAAFDLEGNLLWFRGLGRDYPNASNSLGMSSSLVVVEGVVVAQVENDSESFTAGLDAATGANRWKIDRPKKANWTSPVVLQDASGKTLVALQSAKGVAAVDPATGTVAWNYGDGASTVPSTTVAEGRLFVPSQGLTVLEPQGEGRPPRQAWRSGQLRPGTPSPVVVEGKVLLLGDGGVLTCAASGDGARQWQLRLKGPFSATPVVAGGLLYCVNEKGLVQVVDPSVKDGRVTSELDLGQPVVGTPAIAGGALYVRSDAKLWRVGARARQ